MHPQSNPAKADHTAIKILISLSTLVILVIAGWMILGRRQIARHLDQPQKPFTPVVHVSNTPQWQSFSGHGKISAARFSHDGKLIAVVGDQKELYLLDVLSGSIVQQISDACCTIEAADFSVDGTQLAIAMNGVNSENDGARIRVLRISEGKYSTTVRELREHGNLVHSVAFLRDGQRLLTEIDSDAVLWNVESGSVEKRFEAGVNGVCALSADQSTIVSAGSNSNEVKLWEVASGVTRLALTGHTEGLLALAISSDGTTAASGGYDATARIWDMASGGPKGVLAHGQAAVNALAFSSSGSSLATASDVVRVWNLTTKSQVQMFSVPRVTSLAYSPDDRLLAGTSPDGGLLLWRLP